MFEAAQLRIAMTIVTLLVSLIVEHVLSLYHVLFLPITIVSQLFGIISAFAWVNIPGISQSDLHFDHSTFFLILLPLLIFESGFSIPRKSLFQNFGSVLVYAIIGTFMSAFLIGIIMFTYYRSINLNYSILDTMVLGSILSATDPVSSLAIFGKMPVDAVTHILVFGESMLNDAVSIVLFDTLLKFYGRTLSFNNFIMAIANFLLLFVGSIVVGVLFAMITSLSFRWTNIGRKKALENILIIGCAYITYLVSDVIQLSGIIAIFFYGLTTRHYTYYTISEDSQIGLNNVLASTKEFCELFIFVLLGLSLMENMKQYNILGILVTVIAIIASRAIQIGILTFFLNFARGMDKISWRQQIILWNAGLRGALSYALAISGVLPKNEVSEQIIATVHGVVIVSVFFHGMLTLPLLKILGLDQDHSSNIWGIRASPNKFQMLLTMLDQYITPCISYARYKSDMENSDQSEVIDMMAIVPIFQEGDQYNFIDEKDDENMVVLSSLPN